MYHPQSLFLLALSILVFPSQTQSYTKNKFLDCATTSIHCQDRDWNISYPFRRPSMPPYCGHPMFDVECINSDSILSIKISGNRYRVSDMNYDKQFIGVSNLDYIDYINDTCHHALYNTTIDISLFKYSVNDLNITMFLNCTPLARPSASLNISCPSSERSANKSYYQVGGYGSPPPLDLFGNCNSVVVIPMYKDAASPLVRGRMDLLGVLQDGFGLNWVVDYGWCNDCEESGGICGNDPDSPNGWACFCSDGSATSGTCPGKSHKMYIAIGASVSAAFLIAFCAILLWHIRRKKHQKPGLSNLLSRSFSSNTFFKREAELGESNYHTHIFSYDELDAATDGFNVSRELGDGGFGIVYKGKLRDGRTVAVKRLYEHNYRRLEQFMNEVEILSCLRHQYLVTLYGCTSRHSRELLLVYEYIPNGTVADHLHGPLASKGALPWSTRLSIAIETADALAYLHNVEPQVIHRDVKSNNILLDNNFHVKVADFGLSRLFPLDATHVSTAPQGTPGYVDPEYHQCYQLTDKSDVYSFGVVLVELISSKPAVDINRHRHEINLANLAVAKIQNCQVEELVDLDIGYMEDADIKRMINQVAELAFRCLQLDREMRPCITEVLEGLRGIEGKEAVEVVVVNEVKTKEEGRLLKSDLPCSPDSVTERWQSISTTPSASA